MSLPQNSYGNILSELKEKIRQARIRASVGINIELLQLYWEIGNTIVQQQQQEGWGTKVIDTLAKDLKAEFPDIKGFSVRNLKYMRAFAEAYPLFNKLVQIQLAENQSTGIVQAPPAQLEKIEPNPFVQAELAQLSWYHHTTLLDKVKDPETRFFYIQETIQNGWSRDVMVHQIEGGLHKRIGQLSNNFKNTVAPAQSELIQQLFKDPYKFDFIYLGKEAKERDLEDALVNQLTKFLLELGQHFAFLGRQYKMVLGQNEYFYDLLFYHTRLKRYIVIELKIDEFKPEYKGKMDLYLNLADDQLKQQGDEKSIGLILCKTKDGLVAEYALRDSTNPIGIAEYKINEMLPESIRGELPSIEDLETQIEKEYEELKSPSQKRLDALKDKLAKLKGEEIQDRATHPIVLELIKNMPSLFEAIIKQMEELEPLFVSYMCGWHTSGESTTDIDKFSSVWENEYLNKNKNLSFSYMLNGFRKAGTDSFNTGFELQLKFDTYWYGFVLINYNNQQPFIKKLYHEQFTKEDIALITETTFGFMVNDIEKRVENIKPESR